MRFLKLTLLGLCGLLLFNGPVLALTIGTSPNVINVGSADNLIAQDTIGNSDASELAWVQSILGSGATIDPDKYDVSSTDWTETNEDSSIFALELEGTPSHFFIKLGVGGTNLPDTHYLYENLDELMYAVVNIAGWGGTGDNINIGRVSHVGEIVASVSEPATLLLLGFGMIGIAGFGRKRLLK